MEKYALPQYCLSGQMLTTFHFLLQMFTTSKHGTLHTLDNQVVFICLLVESSRKHPFKDTSTLSFQTYHFKGWASSHVSACTKLSLQHIWLTSWWRTTSLLS